LGLFRSVTDQRFNGLQSFFVVQRMTKVLLTGATGMLGHYVHSLLREYDYQIDAPGRDRCDIISPAQVYDYVRKAGPEAVIHLAAETEVDLCERDPRRAGICNQLSTEAIARAARDAGAWVLYVSTSNVFGSEGKLLYNEIDQPSSVNYYGRSKLLGEYGVQKYLPVDSLIVRAGWMIGGGIERDHKFVGKVVKQIKDGVAGLRAVGDRYGTITPASKLAAFIVASLKVRRTGVLHFASQGVVTRFDIARAIAETLSFKGPVEPVVSAMFPLSAPRPYFEGIESIYLADAIDVPVPRPWKEDLVDYVAQFVG
jgi:dTDP-4-dehydrorhamnose reductase